jgi:DNA-binding MarR family transcriptional regulator
VPDAESDIGLIEQALAMIVSWGNRHDVQQETMRRVGCDLPRGHIWLLWSISRGSGARLSDLAQSFNVDKSALSPPAGRLQREGLIDREADPTDGRAAIVRVTPAGMDLLARLQSTRRAILSELLADWSAAEQAGAAAMLTKVAAVLSVHRPTSPIGNGRDSASKGLAARGTRPREAPRAGG